jgi:Rrf2 family iron-sulfur cluster assembly transcriptional regulator
MISHTAEYAIRAMAALNQLSDGGLVGAGALSRSSGVPANYLSKIMHTLGRAGLVDSVRGPGGGFRLARPANRLTAYEIVALFDDLDGKRRCFLGNKLCSDDHACAAHAMWLGVWDKYETFLRRMTLEKLEPPLKPPFRARPGTAKRRARA